MTENCIELHHTTKVFNKGKIDEMRAISDISIAFNTGTVSTLVGPSGSGKSTLLSLIGCMTRPTSGSIVVQGRDVSKLPERFLTDIRRNTFGFIFQQFYLLKQISVVENVMLPLYPLQLSFREMEQKADRILDLFGILSKRKFKSNNLSGGEQQRVAIARALINDPAIILADEPTAHLDSTRSRELLDILNEINNQGKTVIIATHDPLITKADFINSNIEIHDGKLT